MPIAQFRSNNQPEGKIHIASRSFIHPSSSSIYRLFSGMYPTAAAIALLQSSLTSIYYYSIAVSITYYVQPAAQEASNTSCLARSNIFSNGFGGCPFSAGSPPLISIVHIPLIHLFSPLQLLLLCYYSRYSVVLLLLYGCRGISRRRDAADPICCIFFSSTSFNIVTLRSSRSASSSSSFFFLTSKQITLHFIFQLQKEVYRKENNDGQMLQHLIFNDAADMYRNFNDIFVF